MNNFDRIAPVYDKLVQFVFGKSIRQAQTCFLNDIGKDAHVLILGGGTGWLLAELLSSKPNCKVVYIDASIKMVEMAKTKISALKHDVFFIHGTEEEIPVGSTYDVIITHFYLDLFEHAYCAEVTRRIRRACHKRSLWLASDFIRTTWWHGVMLSFMYKFFSIVSNLETKALPDWKTLIKDSGFIEVRSQRFSKGFISSVLFRLQN